MDEASPHPRRRHRVMALIDPRGGRARRQDSPRSSGTGGDLTRRCYLALWVIVISGTVVLAACGSSGGGQSAASAPALTGAARNDPQLRHGRQVFIAQCARCHGSDGGGGVGPSFKGRVLLRDFPDIGDQIALVTNGRTVMPAFGGSLSKADVEAVVRYEREVLTVQKR